MLQSSVDMDIKHVETFQKQNLVGQGHLPSRIFRQPKKVEKDPESQIVGNNLESYKQDFSFFSLQGVLLNTSSMIGACFISSGGE